MQLYHVCLSQLFEIFIRVKALFGILIERLEICNVRLLLNKVREIIVKFLNKHSKLCSPVSYVVYSQYFVSEEFKDSADAVALNGRPQVSNVHVFSNVWTAEVNKHGLLDFVSILAFLLFLIILGVFESHILSLVNVSNSLLQKVVFQENVKEKPCFVVWTLPHLAELNFFDSLIKSIFRQVLHDCGRHVLTSWVSEAALLFILVEEGDSAWTLIIPVALLLWVDDEGLVEAWHCFLGSPGEDAL